MSAPGSDVLPGSILALLPEWPWPATSGKALRCLTVVRALGSVAPVDVVVVGARTQPMPPHDVGLGASLRYVPVRARGPAGAAGQVLAHRLPWRMAVRRDREALAALSDQRRAPALLWIGSPDLAWALPDEVHGAAHVVDLDDVESAKAAGYLAAMRGERSVSDLAERAQRRIELPMWRRLETRIAQEADLVVVCSAEDQRDLDLENVRVLPNAYPDPSPRCWAGPGGRSVLLVGNYAYEPNRDAATWFVREVLPGVRDRQPDVVAVLAGRSASPTLSNLERPGVTIISDVADLGSLVEEAAVVVAPIRYGGGTRVKLLEAFAYGVPAVSTSLGCYGLDVAPGRELLVADSAQDFARACVEILTQPDLAREVGAAGRRVYERRYAPNIVQDTVVAIAEEAMQGRTRTRE